MFLLTTLGASTINVKHTGLAQACNPFSAIAASSVLTVLNPSDTWCCCRLSQLAGTDARPPLECTTAHPLWRAHQLAACKDVAKLQRVFVQQQQIRVLAHRNLWAWQTAQSVRTLTKHVQHTMPVLFNCSCLCFALCLSAWSCWGKAGRRWRMGERWRSRCPCWEAASAQPVGK